MKNRIIVSALLVVLLSIGSTATASAQGRGCHPHHRYHRGGFPVGIFIRPVVRVGCYRPRYCEPHYYTPRHYSSDYGRREHHHGGRHYY